MSEYYRFLGIPLEIAAVIYSSFNTSSMLLFTYLLKPAIPPNTVIPTGRIECHAISFTFPKKSYCQKYTM